MLDFIDFAHRLADAAGNIIRGYYRQPIPVDHKSDASPVTKADREAEAAMRELIKKQFPGHGIIGEEYGNENEDAEYVWVLDPIDGTASFIAGRPIFVTLIALCRRSSSPHRGAETATLFQGRGAWEAPCPPCPHPNPPPTGEGILRPILGVIDQPITKERWVGDGKTATLNGKPIQVRECNRLEDAVLATTGPQYFTPEGKAFFDSLSAKARQTVYGGDGYNYALLASGQIDLVIEEGLKAHDVMALIPVIEGAGGCIADWEGNPVSLSTASLKIIAFADKNCIAGYLK